MPITIKEHEFLPQEVLEFVQSENVEFCETQYEGAPKYLGICPYKLCASYYIGAEWLTNEQAIVVTPKDDRYDYSTMFLSALECDLSSEYFAKFYAVNFDKKPIKTTAFSSLLTPLIIIHFIGVVKQIVKKGLKKDYIIVEGNLQSKIKGKIKVARNIKYNDLNRRNDRIYCQYQEYTVNTVENRVLKQALIFSKEALAVMKNHSKYLRLSGELNNLLSYFIDVSDSIELRELKGIKTNKIYKQYNDALKVAQVILKRFDYSISKIHITEETTPPFWIDMSRLYEVYVYSKLIEAYGRNVVEFQIKGYCRSAVDFIWGKKVIVDTKYKPKYDVGNQGILDDVRQISAYARDNKILQHIENNIETVECLIIYPEKVLIQNDLEQGVVDSCNQIDNFSANGILENAKPIAGFNKFYKLSVKLPTI